MIYLISHRSMHFLVLMMLACSAQAFAQSTRDVQPVALKFETRTPIDGSKDWDWWQARTAFVPGNSPFLITTMSETGRTGTHNFHDIYQSISSDDGRTWSKPAPIPSLKRTLQADGYEVAPGDLWPTWHARTGKVLVTGKTFNFENGKNENRLREKVSYSVMDPASEKWGPLRFLTLPENDHSGKPIVAVNAGCTQRVDLPNGDILLPVRYWRDAKKHNYTSIVARCSFDGESLTYKEHGTEHTLPAGRGLYEPSLAEFEGEFFLTLRADKSACVTHGKRWSQLSTHPRVEIRRWKTTWQLQYTAALGDDRRWIVSCLHSPRSGQRSHHAAPSPAIHRPGQPGNASAHPIDRAYTHPGKPRDTRQLRSLPSQRHRNLDHLRRRPAKTRETQRTNQQGALREDYLRRIADRRNCNDVDPRKSSQMDERRS